MKKIAKLPCILIFVVFTAFVAYSQPTASFNADIYEGCTPLTVNFTNTSTTGPDIEYKWYFGTLHTSTDKDPVYEFIPGGNTEVKLVVTNTSTLLKDSVSEFINIIAPNADLISIDSVNACTNGNVEFSKIFYIRIYE